MKTALITGIDGALAALVAGALAAQPATRVIGVGRRLPERAPPGVDLQLCDMRGATLLELLHATTPDVVVHLDLANEERAASPAEATGRGNVYRTIELLGACAAFGALRVVLRSSTLVYGAEPHAPAFLPETAPLRGGIALGLLNDYLEIERVAADFAARYPGLSITQLRCAAVAGGGASSPLTRYLAGRLACFVLGFDPRVQVLHLHDAAVAFALAALCDGVSGPLNLAADPPLLLTHAIRAAGGRMVPLPPLLLNLSRFVPGSERPLADVLPFDLEYLYYACVADTRRAREQLGWAPQRAAGEALAELAATP